MKSLFYFLLFLFVFLINNNAVYGQWNYINSFGGKQLEEFKNREMIVMLLEENEDIIEVFKNKDNIKSLEAYRTTIKNINNNLKLVVDSLWPYHEGHYSPKTGQSFTPEYDISWRAAPKGGTVYSGMSLISAWVLYTT